MNSKPCEGWQALGASVQGASHVRHGLPNQDALAWRIPSRLGEPCVLAVADGHGGARHFRSGRGAQLAVEAAIRLPRGSLARLGPSGDLSTFKRVAEQGWPRELTRRWQRAVAADLKVRPFTVGEWTRLEARAGVAGQRSVERRPALAYGTTLLWVVATPAFLLCFQIGDGDILAVSEAGDVTRPLTPDPRCLGVETPSLCAPSAALDFRVAFQALAGRPPALILAATDGYANSFADDESFLKVGRDLHDAIGAEGPQAVGLRLEPWLREASEAGSGDDITLGLLCRALE